MSLSKELSGPIDSLKTAESRKLIWDVIHGYMEFTPLLIAFMDTPQLQRLRYIRQLGGVCYVFPNAADTRFEHALGCCHLAGELIKNLQRKQPELNITDAEVLSVQIGALCHDLGHGPFSHVFARFVAPFLRTDWDRFHWAVKMFEELVQNSKDNHVRDMCQEYGVDIDGYHGALVKAMIRGKPVNDSEEQACKDKPFLLEIVRNFWSGFDVCMMDSVTRDCHNTGMSGTMEWRWYIEYAQVIGGHICTRTKAAGSLADMLNQRRQLYRKAYYDKTVRMIEYKISLALLAAKDDKVILKRDGSRASIIDAISGDMGAYTRLTDSILHQIMANPVAAEIIEEIELRGSVRSMKFIASAAKKSPEADVSLDMDELRQRFSQDLAKACDMEPSSGPSASPTTQQPFRADFVEFDYSNCLLSRNPFECEMFYTREEPDKAIVIPRDQIPRSLPAHFYEVELRVYCTSKRHHDAYSNIKEKFDEEFKKLCGSIEFKETYLK